MPMETMLDAVGLAMLAASAASACLCLLAWHSRFRARIVLLGISLLVCFIVTRLMLERLLPVLTTAPAVLRAVLTQMLDSLALLSGALTLDAALRHWIWYGRLGDGAHRPGTSRRGRRRARAGRSERRRSGCDLGGLGRARRSARRCATRHRGL